MRHVCATPAVICLLARIARADQVSFGDIITQSTWMERGPPSTTQH